MALNNTLNEPAGSAVNFVPPGTWPVSPGITLTNPQAAARLTEEDRVALFERVITLDGDIFEIPDVLHPLEQTFYPPIPEPQHRDDQPPEASAELLVSANPVDQLPVRVEPPFPATAKLAYRRFWQNTFTITIFNAHNFTRAIETQEGMSEVDTTTLSKKLGLTAGTLKLSAELSKTTSHAVTITENRKLPKPITFPLQKVR